MASLRDTLRSIRVSYARRGSHAPVTAPCDSREEVRCLLLSQSYSRWDAPLRDVVHALARHFSAMNVATMSHDQSCLKRIFDMSREDALAFLSDRLKLSRTMATTWCDILWLDRLSAVGMNDNGRHSVGHVPMV